MTNSRSKASTSSLRLALVVLCALTGVAQAGRKRVVVLDLEGPRHERVHDDLVKLLKKTHTVISTDKWDGTAEALGADARSDKGVKQIARKLKIDAIVGGKIEKRRDAYVVRLELHLGKTGAIVGEPVNATTAGPGLDGKALRALRKELVAVIDDVELNRGVPEADEPDEPPAPAVAPRADEPVARAGKAGKKPDEPVARPGKKPDDEPARTDDEPTTPAPRRTRVAAREPEDTPAIAAGAARSSAADTSPGERALDLVAGMSITARSLSFQFRPDFAQPTPGYNGAAVGGVMLDATLYPFALGHAHRGALENLGLSVMYDRAVGIKSRDAMNNPLDTTQSRFGIGAVARYPIGDSDHAPVVGATFSYANQVFEIAPGVDVPNVAYAIFEPGVLFRLPLFSRLVAGLDGKLMLFGGTGQLEDQMHYGTTSLIGFEGAFTLDVLFTRNVFARAALRYETIGLTFQGNGALTAGRDNDLTTADVKSGNDTYVGGFITLGVAL
jgi:hypothetical protein